MNETKVVIVIATCVLLIARFRRRNDRSWVRNFSDGEGLRKPNEIRVMTFNVLADGLSGSDPNLGGFDNANIDFLRIDYRSDLILKQIIQYEPE